MSYIFKSLKLYAPKQVTCATCPNWLFAIFRLSNNQFFSVPIGFRKALLLVLLRGAIYSQQIIHSRFMWVSGICNFVSYWIYNSICSSRSGNDSYQYLVTIFNLWISYPGMPPFRLVKVKLIFYIHHQIKKKKSIKQSS